MRIKFEVRKFKDRIDNSISKTKKINLPELINDKNPSAWKTDIKYYDKIKNRLGWLDLPVLFKENCSEIDSFVSDIRNEGFESAVVLGMGGSSMCPEVFKETFGSKKNYLKLFVLDSTDPETVLSIEKSIKLEKTLFIVSSKSGGTIEVDSFFRYFFEKIKEVKGEEAGNHFIAITDPSTVLEDRARENKFRKIFINPPDIGGRYSALSYFGLVPAALTGIDIQRLLADAEKMMNICKIKSARKNYGLKLGITAGELAKKGIDKITFILSEDISSFGYWVEQLIAESTGKEGKGILPVEGESTKSLSRYGTDRLFVNIYTQKNSKKAQRLYSSLSNKKFPVIDICIKNIYSIGGLFYLWEYATSIMGYSLKINPFDEPNVSESKENTGKVLKYFETENKLPLQKNSAEWKKLKIDTSIKLSSKNIKKKNKTGKKSFEEYLKTFFRQKKKNDYISLMAYLHNSRKTNKLLNEIREILKEKLCIATTSGYGPRFLHSTGQLHKGGKNNGMFIQFVCDDKKDIAIPGKMYSFGILKQSQAIGDFESLEKHGRRAIRIYLGKNYLKGLKNFKDMTEEVLKKN